MQGEGLLHRAAAAVGLASDKAQETKEAVKDQASKGCVVTSAVPSNVIYSSNFVRPNCPPVHQGQQPFGGQPVGVVERRRPRGGNRRRAQSQYSQGDHRNVKRHNV